MKEFVLFFRMDILTREAQPSAEQMEVYMEKWMQWIQHISNLGQLAHGGNHLLPTGRLLKKGVEITDGPHVSNNESVAGYIIIRAKDFNDAVNIARLCPILEGDGTSVEVRETATPISIKDVNRTE